MPHMDARSTFTIIGWSGIVGIYLTCSLEEGIHSISEYDPEFKELQEYDRLEKLYSLSAAEIKQNHENSEYQPWRKKQDRLKVYHTLIRVFFGGSIGLIFLGGGGLLAMEKFS